MKSDVAKMTRAQAERAVAATSDLDVLKKLGDHKNKHVRAKAAYKYKAIVETEQPIAGEISEKILASGSTAEIEDELAAERAEAFAEEAIDEIIAESDAAERGTP